MTNVIDAEWMKFMSRITRQMNCDAVDEEDDECDESVDGDDSMTIKNMHNTQPIHLTSEHSSLENQAIQSR